VLSHVCGQGCPRSQQVAAHIVEDACHHRSYQVADAPRTDSPSALIAAGTPALPGSASRYNYQYAAAYPVKREIEAFLSFKERSLG
jgi:hypothetical protein